MPTTFSYRVRDAEGRTISGSLDADNRDLVANKLKGMGYVPISIDRKSAGLSGHIVIPGLSHRVDSKEISLFSREFATLINASVSLTRALAILAGQTVNKHFATVIDQVRSDLEGGASLSASLAKHPKQFNRLYVSMIRAGESGGNLDRTLDNLSTTLEKQVELRRQIKSAMTYPIAVLGLVLLILSAMLIIVVPIFKQMYKTLGGRLPAPTRVLIGASNLLVHAFPLVAAAVIVSVILVRRSLRTPKGRGVWDRALLGVPVLGGLVQKTAIARFSATLATLLSAGVPILEALDITAQTAGNTQVANGVQAISTGTRRGDSMVASLKGHDVFPQLVTQMIAVGEETGALDALLEKVARFYEKEVQATVDALTALLEPLMIVVLGGAVGATVISLYLPMFNIYKLVGKSG